LSSGGAANAIAMNIIMSEFTIAVAGMVVGFVLFAAGDAIRNGWRSRPTMRKLLKRHFGRVNDDRIKVHSKSFPYRVGVDVYKAVTEWIAENCTVKSQVGVAISDRYMTSVGIAAFLNNDGWYPAALEYNSFDVGEDAIVQCVRDSLWLARRGDTPLAVLWTPYVDRAGCGIDSLLRIDVAHLANVDEAFVTTFFDCIEKSVRESASYRGKILSLDSDVDYDGNSCGIVVHRLEPIERDQVILPEGTLRLLERNLVRFVAQRPEFKRLGMPTKKGLLMYGPPGTGKTHTIRFLASSLKGHTVLLATAEQMGNITQYIALARLLQPSIVVIEDVDLIGRERDGGEAGREALLNRLLNEMDGLSSDAEILFLLTTNKPESLERALAARPGRVDQAIEFPLPDEACRRKLIRLYAAGAVISDDVVSHAARATEGVSASFIKELMRRSIQFNLECHTNGEVIRILQNDIDQAIEELLFAGGSLNRTLLGADGANVGEA
jgi:cell division protease FtsH